MATEFLRLYRDLTKVNIDKPVEDTTFRKERKLVFTKFNHKVSSSPERIRPSKFHGKTARLRQHEARQKAILTKSGTEIERMRALRETMAEMDQQYESNLELKALLEQGKPIPNKLYRKLFGTGTKAEPGDALGLKPHKESRRCLPIIPRKPLANVKDDTLQLGRLSIGCGDEGGALGSANQWTREEIERLTSIYWEMVIPQPLPVLAPSPCKPSPYGRGGAASALPSVHSTNFNATSPVRTPPRPGSSDAGAELQLAWKNYYSTFAKRFQLFYPRRRTVDVIAKVQEYLRTHRFKEPGERQYWASPERLLPGR
jgi:hypothetical protein